MSEAKFTKGEWNVEGTSMAIGSSYRGNFNVTSTCFDGDIGDSSKANANLIAAAPEMYELLSEVSHVLGHELSPTNKAYIKAIKELLAKARGES